MLLETDDEFFRDAVVVLEIKKNKLLMNVLKIMPLSFFVLFFCSFSTKLFGYSLALRGLVSHPSGRSCWKVSVFSGAYQRESPLSKGNQTHSPSCHHIHTSVTSQKKMSERISCAVKRKILSKHESSYSPPAADGEIRQLHSHWGRILFSFFHTFLPFLCLHATLATWNLLGVLAQDLSD